MLGALIGLAGAGLSAAGSAAGASSANNAAQANSREALQQQNTARNWQTMMMFGPEDAMQWYHATQQEYPGIDPAYLQTIKKARAYITAKYPSMTQQLQQAGGQLVNETTANNAAYDRNTGRLDRMGAQMEGQSGDWMDATKAAVKAQLDHARQGADQRAAAQLGLMGPSTMVANQQSANALSFGREQASQFANIGQVGAGMFQNARANRMSMLGGRLAGGEANRANLAGLRYSTAMAPAQARMGMLGSQPFGMQAPPGNGGASPGGAAMGSLGSFASTLGGFGMAGGFGGGGGGGGGGPANGQYWQMGPGGSMR